MRIIYWYSRAPDDEVDMLFYTPIISLGYQKVNGFLFKGSSLKLGSKNIEKRDLNGFIRLFFESNRQRIALLVQFDWIIFASADSQRSLNIVV